MELLNKYNKALQDIYDHVGFEEDWTVCPLDTGAVDFYWRVDGNVVKYADTVEEFEAEDGDYYEDELYAQTFYSKYIYKGEDFTLVFCNPHVDGMKWWRIFDNKKEQK